MKYEVYLVVSECGRFYDANACKDEWMFYHPAHAKHFDNAEEALEAAKKANTYSPIKTYEVYEVDMMAGMNKLPAQQKAVV